MSRALDRCFNNDDLRRLARRRLPRGIFEYLDGGADDETTLRRNRSAFERYALLPTVLRDVSDVDLSVTVLGEKIAFPVVLAPTGMSRLFHHEGEAAVARAAAAAGTIYSLSSVGSLSIEDVAKATSGPKLFQIYVWRDRGVTREFIQRCRESGYGSLCLTVDAFVGGNREKDLRNGLSMPPRITPRTVFDTLGRPAWLWHFLTTPQIRFANVSGRAPDSGVASVMEYINAQLDRTLTWKDVEWMIEQWDGPFAIKGILRADDARRAADAGASAVIVSNHGGRQLDQAPAAVEALPPVVDAVGDRVEVIMDSGVRRGTDVIKALALGARACMIGRAYLYGLGAGGEAGVTRALTLLKNEILRDMQLLGCTAARELQRDVLMDRERGPQGNPH